jgi:hypothetical protein
LEQAPGGKDILKTATLGTSALAALLLWAAPEPVHANIFVVDQGPFDEDSQGTIGEYTNFGMPINPSLITGLASPGRIAVADGFIYVTNTATGTIGKYTTSGETVNASLITGLRTVVDIEVLAGDLYVLEDRGGPSHPGRVGKYTTSGGTVNASLITGISACLGCGSGLAVTGTDLFVSHLNAKGQSLIGHYTISGATINASFITDDFEGDIIDLEVSGSRLFVSHNFGDDAFVDKYGLDGKLIDFNLSHGLASYAGIAVSGTDLFVPSNNDVFKFTTSGKFIPWQFPPIGPPPFGFEITGIAVDNSVPETLSVLWFGLTTAGLLGFARLLRFRRAH